MELSFETQGISLAQALARAGGLQDARADPRGVFVFRFEDVISARSVQDRPESPASSDRQPVVYRLNLSDAGALLLAQAFSMRHRDILYVANAPAVELQKFLNLIGSVVIPYATMRNLAP
jgi:polysaccharide export outer membrane protein